MTIGKKDRAKVDALTRCCEGGPAGAPYYGHAGNCPRCTVGVAKISTASAYGKFGKTVPPMTGYGSFDQNHLAWMLNITPASGPVDRFLDAAIICAFPPPGFKFKDQQPHVTQRGRIVAKPRGSYMAPELTGSVTAAVAFAVQWAPVNWRIIVGNAAVQCRSPEWLARKIVQLTLEHLGK